MDVEEVTKDNIILGDKIECDWCHEQVEKRKTKHWVTGARLCEKCYKQAEDKHNKFLEEFKIEMSKGSLLRSSIKD